VIVEHVEAHDGHPATLRRPRMAQLQLNRRSVGLANRHLGDIAASAILLAVSVLLTLATVLPVHSFIRGDWPAQFFPVYSYLGERLRAFDIPGWNPYQFSGAPFAGDPESGWMYLPAMVIYALLPAEPATAAYIGLHIAFAGLALYFFARLLGLGVVGSLIGGASFAFAWVAPAGMNMIIFFPVAIWLVVALAGVELAVRASSWSARLWRWLLAAFAISQILAVWLGQGAYYALLVIAGWIAYRTLLFPAQPFPPRGRLLSFLLTSLAVFGIGFGLSAPGMLPRLVMVEQSSLAGGVYNVASAWEEAQIGFSPAEFLHEILGGYSATLWWYTGAVALTLAFMAPVIARRWQPMLYFVFVGVCSFILSLADRTPLHTALYAILPRFEGLHAHSPERVVIVFIPAIALLAAATVSFLPQWDRSSAVLVAIALAPAVLTLALSVSSVASGLLLSREVTVLIVASSVLVACIALTKRAHIQLVALIGLVFLTLWDPAGRIAFRGFAEKPQLEQSLQDSLAEASGSFLYANGAASFLAQQSATQPGRYAGFDPALLPNPKTIETISPQLGYRSARGLKNVGMYWLLVHNWGTWFGVEDIQGYNPLQSQRYVAYIDALNGHRQEYHERDLFPAGLRSPLLDLLNLRYLLVPADAPERVDLAPLLADFPSVYADAHVRVLENPEALPRAWLVHQARQVAPGEALGLLADGTVDPRQTALLETAPPTLSAPADPAAETVRLIQDAPDRLELDVHAESPALLMLSEVWDPGWSATVSGVPAPVSVADQLLRAVPIPPGQHTVVLAYDPPLLRVGLAITFVTVLAVIVVWGSLAFRERKRPRPASGHAP
jgi:hypothetical protein